MAGPVVIDPARRSGPTFIRQTAEDAQVLLGLMGVIHSEPLSSGFAQLVSGKVSAADALPLAHFFEEASVLTQRGHLAEDLLFDAFALDLYWDQLNGAVQAARKKSGNPKLCERFEELAARARAYRETNTV